jgi:hypothetical protein
MVGWWQSRYVIDINHFLNVPDLGVPVTTCCARITPSDVSSSL